MTIGRWLRGLPAWAAAALLQAAPGAGAQAPAVTGDAARATTGAAYSTYSPYAGRKHPQRVYFGDTHLHTSISGDAAMVGTRLGPEEAYRFAMGEEVPTSTGMPIRLSRPLDFLVVTDHAEGYGIMTEIMAGNPAFSGDETIARWIKALKAGGREALEVKNEIVKALGENTLPAVIRDPKVVGPVLREGWKKYTALADRYNQPGRFTALIGYEWTSVPGGDNLHRNIIFRDGQDRAEQVVPFSALQSEDPEKLWAWMDGYEKRTGGSILSIPHNANLSSGRMFELMDFTGKPFTRDYAEKRARFDVLAEVMQTKGNSETHPALSPKDEFADFGITGWATNLSMTKAATPAMRPTSFLRSTLQNGLVQEQALGANPFKFGFIGGSDMHSALSTVESDNYLSHLVATEPSPDRWSELEKTGSGAKRYSWHHEGASYAAVWATENTREALWDAMKRKEAYATSGTRMTVRFFGGWDFGAKDASARQIADVGYGRGVPMGGDLPRPPAGAKSPTFLVAAMKDPLWGNLDRIQIVKGWVGKDGKPQEKIHDVVWSGKRKPGRNGKLPPVGDTVDVARATWTNTIGAPELAAAWKDPDFKPSQRAFYYARVIEIPTPRWTAYDQLRFGVKMSPEVPMKHQERAWTSPIWYSPSS